MDQAQTLFDILCERRSIRRFTDKPVEAEKIELLLKAAMAAPSACNLQPWEFVVVNDKDGMDRLRECIDENNGRRYNASAAFAVCANTSYIPWESDGAMDCAASIENILLMVSALGLGAVWIGAFDGNAVKRLLDIPEYVAVNGVVLFGYPAEQKPPRTQYNEEAVYWQKYDPLRAHPARSTDLRFL
jgi:nitroreductase